VREEYVVTLRVHWKSFWAGLIIGFGIIGIFGLGVAVWLLIKK